MRTTTLKLSLTALATALFASGVLAADAGKGRDTTEEPIYGSQLMTQQERIEHRDRMRSLKTAEEREAYRLEHHRRMQERAQERGVTLPDSPPPRGMGMGPGGPGMGQGMMGQGMGRGGPNR